MKKLLLLLFISISLQAQVLNDSINVNASPGQYITKSQAGYMDRLARCPLYLVMSGVRIDSLMPSFSIWRDSVGDLKYKDSTDIYILNKADTTFFAGIDSVRFLRVNDTVYFKMYSNDSLMQSYFIDSLSIFKRISDTVNSDGYMRNWQYGLFQLKGTYVNSVTASAPLSSSGGLTPNVTITQSGAASNGYLSSTDWNIFNNKQPAGTYDYYGYWTCLVNGASSSNITSGATVNFISSGYTSITKLGNNITIGTTWPDITSKKDVSDTILSSGYVRNWYLMYLLSNYKLISDTVSSSGYVRNWQLVGGYMPKSGGNFDYGAFIRLYADSVTNQITGYGSIIQNITGTYGSNYTMSNVGIWSPIASSLLSPGFLGLYSGSINYGFSAYASYLLLNTNGNSIYFYLDGSIRARNFTNSDGDSVSYNGHSHTEFPIALSFDSASKVLTLTRNGESDLTTTINIVSTDGVTSTTMGDSTLGYYGSVKQLDSHVCKYVTITIPYEQTGTIYVGFTSGVDVETGVSFRAGDVWRIVASNTNVVYFMSDTQGIGKVVWYYEN
jgi:hypothetical protein